MVARRGTTAGKQPEGRGETVGKQPAGVGAASGTQSAGAASASSPAPAAAPSSTAGLERLLPRVADATGTSHENPSRAPVVVTAVAALALVTAGLVLALSGRGAGLATCGYILEAVGVCVLVGFDFAGARLAERFLRRGAPEAPLHPEEREIGAFLARDLREYPHTAFCRALDDGERAAIDANRRAEARLLHEWLAGTGIRPARVTTASDDGTPLSAHVILADPESGRWVLTAHGYRGTWGEHLMHARRYAQAGFNLLMPDLRAHGESGGELIGMGWLDRRGLVAWARWVVAEHGADVQLVLHGHSMGAAAVCMALAEDDLPPQVKGGVSDCAYSDLWNVACGIARRGMHVPPHPLLDFARVHLSRMRGGYDIAHASAEHAAARLRAPLLVIHGEKDSFVAPYMARRIFSAIEGGAAEPVAAASELVMFPHAGHCLSALADPERYYGALSAFLARVLDGGTQAAQAPEPEDGASAE